MELALMNSANCASIPLPMTVPVLLSQFSGSNAMSLPSHGTILLPQPVISFTPSPQATPSSSSFSFPSIQSPRNSLLQFLGDYFTVSDSRHPEKYKNADPTKSPWKRIVQENHTYRVFFNELSREDQFAQIRVAQDGRIQLFSTECEGYSYFLVNTSEPVSELLRWQNEYDLEHFVDWRRIKNRPKFGDSLSASSVSRRNSISRESVSSHSIRSSSAHDDILPPVGMDPILDARNASILRAQFERRSRSSRRSLLSSDSPDGLKLGSVSRGSSPESRLQKDVPRFYDRDSKQNLVTRVEPEVNELIGEYYAEEKDYRPNQKGRWGPPVLRGEDVLFIPAKKQAALENVTQLIEAVKATSTIVAASMVCQKKKKRQKKGFLIYLQLASGDEVKTFLEGPYRHFDSTVQGVKKAVFENDTK